jgi:hypothetical protein
MGYQALVHADDFHGTERSQMKDQMRLLQNMVEALSEMNQRFLEDHRKKTDKHYPGIYETAPLFGRSMDDTWRDIPTITAQHIASHTDLACWRIAELRHFDIDASPVVGFTNGVCGLRVRIKDANGVHFEDVAAGLDALARET